MALESGQSSIILKPSWQRAILAFLLILVASFMLGLILTSHRQHPHYTVGLVFIISFAGACIAYAGRVPSKILLSDKGIRITPYGCEDKFILWESIEAFETIVPWEWVIYTKPGNVKILIIAFSDDSCALLRHAINRRTNQAYE